MKNVLMKLIVLACVLCTAGLALELRQFALSDFNRYDTWQNWESARMITLNVKAGTSVYITNYVSSWYGIPDLDAADYEAGYDMSPGQYGYIPAVRTASGVAAAGDFIPSSGETVSVTYRNPDGPQSLATEGYLLGMFDKDAEIFLAMTPRGYEEQVDSRNPVNDPYGDPAVFSVLVSRQANYLDLADNVRVNFGLDDSIGHEFVLGYVDATAGQPLPGMLFSGLLVLGMGAATRIRRTALKLF